MSDRLRLTILGGFLGAGKTTWLRHQLNEGTYADAHLIVNEAATEPVDDRLLHHPGGLSVIAGGCACCDAADDLRRTLRTLCDDRSAGSGPDEVMLETSGLADPGRIVALIQSDPVLTRHIVLTQIIVLVDAVEGPGRIATESLARAQIAAADQIILTKTDQSSAYELRATLTLLAPGAEVAAAVQGVAIPLPALPPETQPIPIGQDSATPIAAHVLDVSQTDWPGLSVWLSALIHARGRDIMRIKGVVNTPAGPLLLQSVGARMQRPERIEGDAGQLVLIGRGTTRDALNRSLATWTESLT